MNNLSNVAELSIEERMEISKKMKIISELVMPVLKCKNIISNSEKIKVGSYYEKDNVSYYDELGIPVYSEDLKKYICKNGKDAICYLIKEEIYLMSDGTFKIYKKDVEVITNTHFNSDSNKIETERRIVKVSRVCIGELDVMKKDFNSNCVCEINYIMDSLLNILSSSRDNQKQHLQKTIEVYESLNSIYNESL